MNPDTLDQAEAEARLALDPAIELVEKDLPRVREQAILHENNANELEVEALRRARPSADRKVGSRCLDESG